MLHSHGNTHQPPLADATTEAARPSVAVRSRHLIRSHHPKVIPKPVPPKLAMPLASVAQDDSQRELKRSREEGKRDLDAARKEVASLQASLDVSGRELNTERQAVWGLEKVRADLATELEKSRMVSDSPPGEVWVPRRVPQ